MPAAKTQRNAEKAEQAEQATEEPTVQEPDPVAAAEAAQKEADEAAKAQAKADGVKQAELKAAHAEEKFSVERLTNEAAAFIGVEPHVAAGAFHGRDESAYTIDKARQVVNAWLAGEEA